MTRSRLDRDFKPCGGNGKPPKLDDLLKNSGTTRVIVALGGNSLSARKPDPAYQALARLISENKKSCDWVGPAWRQPAKSKASSERLERANLNIPAFTTLLKKQITAQRAPEGSGLSG